jgi:hypothetical protein
VTSKNLLLTSFSPFRKDGLCTTQRGCCSAHLPTDMNFHGNTPVDVFHDRTPLICPTKTCSVPLSAKTGKVVCTSSSNRGPPRQDAAHLSNRKPHPATVDPPTGRRSALTAPAQQKSCTAPLPTAASMLLNSSLNYMTKILIIIHAQALVQGMNPCIMYQSTS